MNTTFVPWQIEPAGFAAMLTDAVTFGFTVIVNTFEVTGLETMQVRELLITQEIRSPETRELLEYVGAFVPTFIPFFFH